MHQEKQLIGPHAECLDQEGYSDLHTSVAHQAQDICKDQGQEEIGSQACSEYKVSLGNKDQELKNAQYVSKDFHCMNSSIILECEKYPRAQLMNSLADPAAVCKSLSHLLRKLKIHRLQPKLRDLDKVKCAAAQQTLSAQILDEALQFITKQNFEFSNLRIFHFNYHRLKGVAQW